jgi:hypothetical protein
MYLAIHTLYISSIDRTCKIVYFLTGKKFFIRRIEWLDYLQQRCLRKAK